MLLGAPGLTRRHRRHLDTSAATSGLPRVFGLSRAVMPLRKPQAEYISGGIVKPSEEPLRLALQADIA